jgi:hypothetical protein
MSAFFRVAAILNNSFLESPAKASCPNLHGTLLQTIGRDGIDPFAG